MQGIKTPFDCMIFLWSFFPRVVGHLNEMESLDDVGNSDAERHCCFLVLLWKKVVVVADVKLGGYTGGETTGQKTL
jgi:hypothetical protein